MAGDLKKMKNLPPVETLQAAVKRAYMILRKLELTWAGKSSIPPSARALANSCLAFGILFDTFMGRSMEWELLPCKHLDEQLSQGLDYILCTKHKTSRTYGDLAKYLSPGLVEALKSYRSLPRSSCEGNLLLPAKGGDKVSFQSCLRTFCSKFLPSDKTFPTVNLVRKWFHSTLVKLTDTKEKLKDLMVLIDAHSVAVQNKHYLLKDPADDVKLARQFVKTVIGKTVRWPSDEEVNAFFQEQGENKWLVEVIAGQDDFVEVEVCETDEEIYEELPDEGGW